MGGSAERETPNLRPGEDPGQSPVVVLADGPLSDRCVLFAGGAGPIQVPEARGQLDPLSRR